MSLRWVDGLEIAVAPDGWLILRTEKPEKSYRYPPLATLALISMQRHGGDPQFAAAEIAQYWRLDWAELATSIVRWLEELRAAGLLQDDG
jgi:hypothetical protein